MRNKTESPKDERAIFVWVSAKEAGPSWDPAEEASLSSSTYQQFNHSSHPCLECPLSHPVPCFTNYLATYGQYPWACGSQSQRSPGSPQHCSWCHGESRGRREGSRQTPTALQPLEACPDLPFNTPSRESGTVVCNTCCLLRPPGL